MDMSPEEYIKNGNPVEAKYGITHEQVISAYKMAMERGAKRFGLHTMVASNERDYSYIVETARMLLQISAMVEEELGIRFEEGRGVPRDLEKARKLYRIAVISTGGTTFYYSPGANGNAGLRTPGSYPSRANDIGQGAIYRLCRG